MNGRDLALKPANSGPNRARQAADDGVLYGGSARRAGRAARTAGSAYQGHDADGNLTSEYGVLGGDSDCNGAVDFDDINYFVAALVSEASWVSYYKAHHDQQEPPCDYIEANDANGDHAVNFNDINPFVALIVNGAGDVSRRYTWDAENRLLKFVLTPQAPETGSNLQEFYGYDYLGRRVFKQVDIFVSGNPVTIEKRRFIWDGWKLLEELDVRDPEAPAIARQYTWGLDLAGLSGAVNSLEGAGTIGGLLAVAQAEEAHEAPNAEPSVTANDAGDFLFFYDGNGNVGQLVAWKNRGTELNPDYAWADARLAAAYEYDPYGTVSAMKGWDATAEEISSGGPIVVANRFRFSTKYFDANSGLHYFGYRYYSPRLGRWISRDPIDEEGGVNLYPYAANVQRFAQRDPVASDGIDAYTYVGNSPTLMSDALGLRSLSTEEGCWYSEATYGTYDCYPSGTSAATVRSDWEELAKKEYCLMNVCPNPKCPNNYCAATAVAQEAGFDPYNCSLFRPIGWWIQVEVRQGCITRAFVDPVWGPLALRRPVFRAVAVSTQEPLLKRP